MLCLPVYTTGKEVNEDEEAHEQGRARKGSCVLDCHETTGQAASRNSMPQMKRVKELVLLVSNNTQTGRRGWPEARSSFIPSSCVCPFSRNVRYEPDTLLISS
jgi:hypothetical protein